MTAAPFDVKKMCCRGAKLPLLMWKQSLWNFTSASSVFRFVLPASLFQPSPTGGEPARSLRRARFHRDLPHVLIWKVHGLWVTDSPLMGAEPQWSGSIRCRISVDGKAGGRRLPRTDLLYRISRTTTRALS